MTDMYTCKQCGAESTGEEVIQTRRCGKCGHNEFTQVRTGPDKCDFCSSTEVEWVCPCRDFRQEIIRGSAMEAGSRGNWLACGPCHSLILRQDRTGLAMRSTKRLVRKRPELRQVGMKNLQAEIRRSHDNFWANREGEPKRLEIA